MIQIQLTKKQSELRSLKLRGHAESAPYGQDLVCAGVSAIVLSSLNAIDELYPDACRLQAERNRVTIQVVESSASLQSALRFLEEQLRCMAAQYPDSISLNISSEF